MIGGTPRSLVDVTLDLEDGAPVGQEEELRQTFLALLSAPENRFHQAGVRIHAPGSKDFERDLQVFADSRAANLAYITIPKVRSVTDVVWATGVFEAFAGRKAPPIHALIETPEAVADVREIAKLNEVHVLDFGLMDFISHLGGAIPSECMRSPGQFDHPLLQHVKVQIALAALSAGKVASHNVTVDFRDPEIALSDARRARLEFGFTRMWSIHPTQVDPIIRALMPSSSEVAEAHAIIDAARAADWGPIEHGGRLHDRASYRFYWGVLQRAEG
jgi:citrate lyase subunit beta/citryl-CoA lyase